MERSRHNGMHAAVAEGQVAVVLDRRIQGMSLVGVSPSVTRLKSARESISKRIEKMY